MGFVAIKMGVSMIQKAKGSTADLVEVVVAAKPIEAASLIDKTMLKMAGVPKTLVPPGVFSKPDSIIGRVASLHVATGLPVSAEMLAPVGAEPGLPSQIPPGFRAMSVKVDEASAVAGFAMPGHHVDIYSVENPRVQGARSSVPVSKLLVEDVQVGAVGQSIKTVDPDGKTTKLTRSVTLYVRPEDVPAIDVATRGTIRLVLRGTADAQKSPGSSPGKVMAGLGRFFETLAYAEDSMPRAAPRETPPSRRVECAAPARAEPYRVAVYRGRAVEELKFESAGSSQRSDLPEGRTLRAANPGNTTNDSGPRDEAPPATKETAQ
jgi:pilus assembly protein CpaB